MRALFSSDVPVSKSSALPTRLARARTNFFGSVATPLAHHMMHHREAKNDVAGGEMPIFIGRKLGLEDCDAFGAVMKPSDLAEKNASVRRLDADREADEFGCSTPEEPRLSAAERECYAHRNGEWSWRQLPNAPRRPASRNGGRRSRRARRAA